MTLLEVLGEAAASTEGIERVESPDGSIAWRRGELVFASLDAARATASYRLDPTLAAAARRTPDTAPSAAGPEWVRFTPLTLDDHARDRARSWFEAAARRAG
jgi:hypothetical protein